MGDTSEEDYESLLDLKKRMAALRGDPEPKELKTKKKLTKTAGKKIKKEVFVGMFSILLMFYHYCITANNIKDPCKTH